MKSKHLLLALVLGAALLFVGGLSAATQCLRRDGQHGAGDV